jgi:maltose alpha-D-glucosyltransferase / alpha-amylase
MSVDLSRWIEILPEQRWFGFRGRPIASIDVIDEGRLDEGEEPLILAIACVRFEDGNSALFHLPVVVSDDGVARDATEDVHRLKIIGDLLAHGQPIKGERGVFHFSGPGLDPSAPLGSSSIRAMDAEQSNTSIVLDESVILKFFRRVESGPNPDLELTRLLTNEGFKHIPPQVGEIFYEGDEENPRAIDLGIAQRFVQGASEGWTFVLEHLPRLYDEIHEEDASEDRAVLTEERSGDLLASIEQLGEVTGELHVALAAEGSEPDLHPEAVGSNDLEEWSEAALKSLKTLSQDVAEIAAMEPAISERLVAVASLPPEGMKTRIHGDYHLGQVLRRPRQWLILDFEGEPARPLEERRRKQSPLRDVAGMLRSFSYAAYASLFARAEADGDEWGRLEPWALTWEALARDRFLSAYLSKSHEGRFLPADRDELATLLDFFELEKAIYEVGYEVGHRPEWTRIPLKGIAQVIAREATR